MLYYIPGGATPGCESSCGPDCVSHTADICATGVLQVMRIIDESIAV